MKKRSINPTNEKALGRQSKGSKKRATNKGDSSPTPAIQLPLDLGDLHIHAIAQRAILEHFTKPESKPLTKIATMLDLFLRGRNFNRFEAEDHHDHCLHSTVSTLQNGFGIIINRMSETVPCLRGRSTVRCKRYWLDTSPDNIAAARALLAYWVKP